MSAAETALSPLPGEGEEPVFAEAWHAEVLAIAHGLSEAAVFTPGAWSEAFGAALRDAEKSGAPDTEETYYRAALSALESLVAAYAPETAAALPNRLEDWRQAFLNTPHGKPVELGAGQRD